MRVETLNSVYEFKIIGEVNKPTISQESDCEKNKREWHNHYKSRYFLGIDNYAYQMGMDPEKIIDLGEELFLENAKTMFHEGQGKNIQNMTCSIISPFPYEGNYYGLTNIKIDDIPEALKKFFTTEIKLTNVPIRVIDNKNAVHALNWFSFMELRL